MFRLSGILAAFMLVFGHMPLTAATLTTAESACAPLLATGEQKGIKFGKDTKKTGLFGAIGGSIVGGLIGLATANNKNKDGEGRNKAGDVVKGAAIGAAVGGVVGIGIGQIAEKRRAAFETESAYLACEIKYAEEEISLREQQAAAAEQDLAAAKSEAAALRTKIAANQAKTKDLRALSASWKKKIEQYDRELEAWNQQINYVSSLASRTQASPGESVKALARRRQELASKKGEFQTRYNRLAAVRDEFILQRTVLGA